MLDCIPTTAAHLRSQTK